MRGGSGSGQGVMPQGDADFGGVLAALLARKWLILGLTLLAFAGAAVFVTIAKPKYTAEAKVLLEYRDNYFTRPDKETRGFEQPLDAEAVQSQVQAIMSRDLAKAVIKKLNLAGREEFDPVQKDGGVLKRILSLVGLGKDPLATAPEERVLEKYFEKLLVFNLGKSRVISIEFSSQDKQLAADGANMIADEYIRFQRDAKKSTTQGASSWLANAIEPMRLRVAEAEGRVEAYRAQNGLLVGASNATVATQQLGEMSTQMSNARATQSELQAKARIIREALRSGRIFETSEVVNNELVRRLLEQRVAMKTQIALEERSLLPGHPRMKELTAQLADLESQIRVTAERTARTLENDSKVAGARLQSVQAELDAQKRTAATANEAEVQLRALEREAKALRDNYEQYLAKYRDTLSRDSDAASPADARVISRANVPLLPTFPKKVPIILLATLATLVLSSAIVITRRLFATDFFVSEEGVPVEAPAPVVAAQPVAAPVVAALVGIAAPPSPVAAPPAVGAPTPAPVAGLAALVADLKALKRPAEAVIAGAHAFGADVTAAATALPLARLLARDGATVLVDMAGAAPDIDTAVGRFEPMGVTDILAGAAAFGAAIHRDGASRLHIIPFGVSGHGSDGPEVEAPAFRSVLAALAQSYDFVIIAAGPLGEALDALVPLEDAVLMISAHDERNADVALALAELEELRPGAVTLVVEEPAITAPSPANDRFTTAHSAA